MDMQNRGIPVHEALQILDFIHPITMAGLKKRLLQNGYEQAFIKVVHQEITSTSEEPTVITEIEKVPHLTLVKPSNVPQTLVYMNNKQSLEVGMSPISKELENLIRRIDLELTQTQESIITRQEIAHH